MRAEKLEQLRDEFAKQTLEYLLADMLDYIAQAASAEVAATALAAIGKTCYAIADAMLVAREGVDKSAT